MAEEWRDLSGRRAPGSGARMPVEAHILAQRLGRDLDALTGARLLMETVGDREVTATMLRLVIRHGQTAAMRARALLAELSGEDGRGER